MYIQCLFLDALLIGVSSDTGNHSTACNLTEAEVDERMQQYIDTEDPDTIVDLRHHNCEPASKYELFWDECGKFLHEDIDTAVDDRRHGDITHLARAISVRDLCDQVKARLPLEFPIPSIEWIFLQFWPKTPRSQTVLQHTNDFTVHFMVQQRQFRHNHINAHYAAAVL